MQIGIPYALTSPDGIRAVVGNSAAAKADPDWIGFLAAQGGVTIAKTLRGAIDELADADGAVLGNQYRGAATIAMNGVLDPNASPATLNVYEQKLRKAMRSINADGELRYTPLGLAERVWYVRQAQDPEIGGGNGPWSFGLQLTSGRDRALSPAESSQIIIPGAAAGELGVASPISSPLTSALGATGQATITPPSDLDTWPRFRIVGPITNPRVLNNSLGLEVRVAIQLLAGEFLDIYPERGQVFFNGVTPRDGAVDRAASRWWKLRANLPNDIRLLATAYSTGAMLTVYWRNAFDT